MTARVSTAVSPPASAGQGIVEYGLIFGGSAVITLVTLVFLGPLLADAIQLITMLIYSATGGE